MTSGSAPPLDAVIRRLEHTAWRNVAGEHVVVNLAGATVHGLNGAGGLVWDELVEHTARTLEQLSIVVAQHYGIDAEVAAQDVRVFVEQLRELGLVDVQRP